jgi:hypothetical protein
MIVALTGNIAAGKSTVVALFKEWGAGIVDADQVVRDLQRPGTEVFRQIVERFGKEHSSPRPAPPGPGSSSPTSPSSSRPPTPPSSTPWCWWTHPMPSGSTGW